MPESNKVGSLMFAGLDDLITKFARFNDLADFSILVVSSEIIGSLKTRSVMHGFSTNVSYESKYDNIEFVDSLRPPASAVEYAYANNKGKFYELYESYLLNAEPFSDMCAIVDMIVNEGIDVIIVFSQYDTAGKIHVALRDFILGEFGVQGYLYEELERLITYYADDKDMYQKIVKTIGFEIPESFDGEDISSILKNVGNVEEIRKRLEMQKGIAASMNASPGEEDDIMSIYFNRFTEDLETKVKELLLRRSDDDIKDMCRAKGIRILKTATKESLVNKILHEMRLDSKRVKEYED